MGLLIERRSVKVPRSALERMFCVVSKGNLSKRPSEVVASCIWEGEGVFDDVWSSGQLC